MLEILDIHLKSSANPEIYAMIDQAFTLFELYGIEDYTIGYEDILLTADEEGISESIIKICNLTSDIQDSILTQLQIDLNDEATVSEGNFILRAMRQLENSEHMSDIAQICQEKSPPEEQLAEILSIVTGLDEERILILLETVGDALIKQISSIATAAAGEKESAIDVEANRVYVKNLLNFSTAVDSQWLYILERIKAGEKLGKRYSEYHKETLAAMEDKRLKEPMPDDLYAIKLAIQLFAAALISIDGANNVRLIVMEELSKTYGDLSVITPIYNELDSLSIKFQTYQTNMAPITKTLPKEPSILNVKPL